MDLVELNEFMIKLGEGKRLSAADKAKIKEELPSLIKIIKAGDVPAKIILPSGDKLGSATRLTALKCHALLLARKAFGSNYIKVDSGYEQLAMDVLFYVMRAYFNCGGIKGEFCCPPCTLSLWTLYKTNCFKWVDCNELTANIEESYQLKKSVFEGQYSQKYADWAMSIK